MFSATCDWFCTDGSHFVVQKSPHKFSLIGKDRSHEQYNKSLQSHGGAVVIYEIPETLTLFMLAGPDCSRCLEEFEVVLDIPRSLFITKKPTVYTLGTGRMSSPLLRMLNSLETRPVLS